MRNDVAGERDTRGLPTKQAWLYGAVYDDLTEEDITYVVKEGQTVAPAGTEYSEATVDDGEGGRRKGQGHPQDRGRGRRGRREDGESEEKPQGEEVKKQGAREVCCCCIC